MKVLGKPEPHSDVLNNEPATLLLGYGWVGQHVHKYFKNAEFYTPETGLCDKDGNQLNLPWNNMAAVKKLPKNRKMWDVAFISVPTPMNEDGTCDISIVEKCVEMWKSYVDLFIIRSTVTPGTVKHLEEKFNTNVVMQPEYIGETLGHPLLEPRRDVFIIVGGRKSETAKAAKYWSLVLHADCKIRQVSGRTAEFCKYMENAFLATKVMFVNDWARLAATHYDVDFLELREAWLDDPRINRSHTMAYEDNPGFAGKCLPKDLNSIVQYARLNGTPLHVIEALLLINAHYREGVKTDVPLLPQDYSFSEWVEDLQDMAEKQINNIRKGLQK